MKLMDMEELKVTLQLSNIKYKTAKINTNIIVIVNESEEIEIFIKNLLDKHKFEYFYNPFGDIYVYSKENLLHG